MALQGWAGFDSWTEGFGRWKELFCPTDNEKEIKWVTKYRGCQYKLLSYVGEMHDVFVRVFKRLRDGDTRLQK